MKKALTVMGIVASSLGAVALIIQNVTDVIESSRSLAGLFGVSTRAHELQLVCKDEVSFDQWQETRFDLVGFNRTGDDLQVRIEYGFGDDPEAGSFHFEGPVLSGSADRRWQTITVPMGQNFEKSVRLPRLELLNTPEIDPVEVEIHWELHSINDEDVLRTGDHLILIRGPYD